MSYPSSNPTTSQHSFGTVPLDQPLYGASFGDAVKRFFKKYATFSGRASRSEYWWVMLFSVLVTLVLYVITFAGAFIGMNPETGAPGGGIILGAILLFAWGLAVLVPSIAVGVRRLHDGNFSGWWYLLNLVPGASIVVLVFMFLPSNPQGARFDENGGYSQSGPGGGYGQSPYGQPNQGQSPYGQPNQGQTPYSQPNQGQSPYGR